MEVRLATLDDNEAIRAIYNVEVVESTVTFDLVPRSVAQQREWLSARSGAHAVLVAADDAEVVAFGSLSPYRDRPAYSTSVEDSVYVRRDRQVTRRRSRCTGLPASSSSGRSARSGASSGDGWTWS
jgi:phosphinothricin acetyltransferase